MLVVGKILFINHMTLCLAWRKSNNLNLLSDSRLTGNQTVVTDNANKVFTIKICVSRQSNSVKQIIFDSAYGLCFAGSFLNGSILADTISELTSDIVIYDAENVNFDKISEIAFTLYEYISRHLMEINNERGLSEVFFIGYCPEKKENIITKFFSQISENQTIEFQNQKIDLKEGEYVYLGDSNAVQFAKQLEAKIKPPYTEFHLMSEVIKKADITTVGGSIQYGCIVAEKFRTYGIVDYELYEPQNETEDYKEYYRVKELFNFRSIPFNWEDSKLSKLKLSLGKVFMAPYMDKRNLLQNESDNRNKEKFK